MTSENLQYNQVTSGAETFIELYYKFMDKHRSKLAKMYLDEAVLVWNGSSVTGATNIQKFLEELPSSDHIVHAMDCQPVSEIAVKQQLTIMVVTSGFVRFSVRKLPFQQTFLITTYEDKWKVVSDCFQFQEPAPAPS